MTKPPLVVLAGKKRSGKNTLGRFLVEQFDYKEFAFADALREIMMVADPIVTYSEILKTPVRYSELINAIGYERAKEEYPEVRRLLKKFGTEGVRNIIGEDTWVNTCFKRIRNHPGPAVITDCRFLAEQYAAQLHGGLVVLLRRVETEDPADTHSSEVELEQMVPDMMLWNDGDSKEYLSRRAPEVHKLAMLYMNSLTR